VGEREEEGVGEREDLVEGVRKWDDQGVGEREVEEMDEEEEEEEEEEWEDGLGGGDIYVPPWIFQLDPPPGPGGDGP
jgi:hypothetical protein